MFDIAWTELGVIAVVALIVIGPKDLPKVMRTAGQWTAKARAMAREFQSGLDEMVRESELADIRKAAEDAVKNMDIGGAIKDQLDPGGELKKALDPTILSEEMKAATEPNPPVVLPPVDTAASDPYLSPEFGESLAEPQVADAAIPPSTEKIEPPHETDKPAKTG